MARIGHDGASAAAMSRADQIEQRAAEWLVRRDEPGWAEADQQALDAWLADSVGHQAAYWRLAHGWRAADRMSALRTGSRIGLRAFRSRRLIMFVQAIAAAIVIVVGIGFWAGHHRSGPHALIAATKIGQRGDLTLSDGSIVKLNTASKTRALLADRRREVWLDRGEAYFDVAHDRSRPFVIHAGKTVITVLGTKFGVRREGDRVAISVIAGRVQITAADAAADGRATVIGAGDTVLTSDTALIVGPRSTQRVESALAWRYGMMRFDHEPLANVVAEFNRYGGRRIEVADPAIGAIRIGGSFHTDNAAAFLRLLQSAYGLSIDRSEPTIKISG